MLYSLEIFFDSVDFTIANALLYIEKIAKIGFYFIFYFGFCFHFDTFTDLCGLCWHSGFVVGVLVLKNKSIHTHTDKK